MQKFICGAVFGIIVSSIGINGIATLLNNVIFTVKTKSEEMAKDDPYKNYNQQNYSNQSYFE